MELKKIKKEIIKDEKDTLNFYLRKIETEEGINSVLSFFGKKYKGNVKQKLKKFIEKNIQKRITEKLNKIEKIQNSKDFQEELLIIIEWKKSKKWGRNPKAYTNFGFKGATVSGCGYDKRSTALAKGLNSHLPLLKILYIKKEQELQKNNYISNREIFGYGSGYGILPYFEGGVGVNCYITILRKLGYKLKQIINTQNTEVYKVVKK